MFGNGSFHLLLSHLLASEKYFQHYQLQRDLGAYLVLDNSAHEHKAGEAAWLLREQALELNAQEVVVPDVLEDSGATIEASMCALECWFEDSDSRMQHLNPALMYVPQAKDPLEWKSCLLELVSMHEYVVKRRAVRSDFVIGISKDYEMWPGGLATLLDFCRPFVLEKRAKVHLLGWGRQLWALNYLARTFPWVRSTDSAKPFVYAMHNIELKFGSEVPEYPGRPFNYFETTFREQKREIAVRNCSTFRLIAEGRA